MVTKRIIIILSVILIFIFSMFSCAPKASISKNVTSESESNDLGTAVITDAASPNKPKTDSSHETDDFSSSNKKLVSDTADNLYLRDPEASSYKL